VNPRLTFEFSEIVGAIYAVEMLSESHLVKTDIKYPIQVFSQELLEEYCRELSKSLRGSLISKSKLFSIHVNLLY